MTGEPAGAVLAHGAGFEAEAAAEVGEGDVAELPGALTDPLLEALMRVQRRATLVVADADPRAGGGADGGARPPGGRRARRAAAASDRGAHREPVSP